jgi:antitoxin ParD1/3/4
MNVSLTAELESWIQGKVKEGLYKSASEVVREGLRLLLEREEQRRRMVEELRGELALGVEQLDRGASRPLTRDVIDEVKRIGRERVGIDPRTGL